MYICVRERFILGLEKDGVFSMAANLSRIRAQLTLEANKRYVFHVHVHVLMIVCYL